MKLIFTLFRSGPEVDINKNGLRAIRLSTVDDVMNELIETPENEEVFVIVNTKDDPKDEPIRKTVLENLSMFKAKVRVASLIVLEPCEGTISMTEMSAIVAKFMEENKAKE